MSYGKYRILVWHKYFRRTR